MSKFKVDIFSPDGDFTEEEVKQILEDGIKYQEIRDRAFMRLSPIEVEEIPARKKSAFQEWNSKTPVTHRNAASAIDRKDGWNAAIDKCIDIFNDLNNRTFTTGQLEELKEP